MLIKKVLEIYRLEDFQTCFVKVLDKINSQGYEIDISDNSTGTAVITCYYDDNLKTITINPGAHPYLDGDNKNLIWDLFHEIGHILNVGKYNQEETSSGLSVSLRPII